MRCPTCNREIAANAKFCIECGVALYSHCFGCSRDNPLGAKFCLECGAALDAPTASAVDASLPEIASTSAMPAEGYGRVVAERRHLTVLFCDLVDSTAMASQLDPEEWHEIAREYQREASAVVERFGGHVAKFLGDGLMVFFGWPQAHDNDPERGVRAGLALLESVVALNSRLLQSGRRELSLRVGIHTGPAVIGEGGKAAPDIFGDTPNVAARVQTAAEPGTVVITAATRHLVSGRFLFEDLGPRVLKGISQPLQLWHAVQPAGVSDRLSASVRTLVPFVGRDEELRMLLSRFERACGGEGQTVLVMGEAGIGKTRLIQEFRERIAGERHTWIDTAADALFSSSPLHPLKQAVDHALLWRGDEREDEKIAMLEASMTTAGLVVDHALPLVARMLGIAVPGKYPAVLLSPEQERDRLLVTLAAWTLGSARAQPMVLVLEDLHWADPSTLAIVRMLAEQCATAPLFAIVTARPEFVPAWPSRGHHQQLTLGRLSDREVRQMIENIAARVALDDDIMNTLAHRTSGVPLFIEELTRLVVDEGVKSAAREIPATLSGSLLARLDRLGEAKMVAQSAAVIGRDFDYRMLRAVSDLSDEQLDRGLKTLADADLVYVRGVPPEALYRFKHALVRDAAYELLFKSRRRELHGAIATILRDADGPGTKSQPELVAYHFAEAGDAGQASKFWQLAGESSAARAAFLESEEHFGRAIAALHLLPASDENAAREMQLQLAVGQVMVASRGYSAPETANAYARARSLSEGLARALPQAVIMGQLAVALTRGDLKGARQLADCALERCSGGSRKVAQSWAHYSQGQTRFFCGDLSEAEAYLMRSVELYHGERSGTFPQNPGIDSLAVAGSTAWLLGRPAVAIDRVSRAWQEAHDFNLPFDIAFVGPWISSVHMWCGDFRKVLAIAEEMLGISTEHHFPHFIALAHMYKGSALCALGNCGEGLPLVKQGLDRNFALGRRLALPELLTWLAEAQMRAGALRDSASTLEDALQAAPDELYWRPETLRLRGEVTLLLAHPAGHEPDPAGKNRAERDFRDARDLARKIGARSLELRAVTNLARMPMQAGEKNDAREELASLLRDFEETESTLDIRRARELLA